MAKRAIIEAELTDYYGSGKVLEYYLATNRAGKSYKPLVAGAAFFNEVTCCLDLHFINFKYRKSYIKNIIGEAKNENVEFELALGARQ